MTPKAGRVIAWLSFALGIAVSVAGNVLHSALTPAGPGELIGAAFWPLALMLSIEILTRVRWQLGAWWMAARVAGLVLVGTVAAVLSYRHLAGLMTSWGEDSFNSHLGPLAVDGLMLLAATALLSISKEPGQIEEKPTAVDLLAEKLDIPADVRDLVKETPGTWQQMTSESIDQVTNVEEKSSVMTAEKAPSKLHVVSSVSETVSAEAAKQAWIQSGGKLSAQQVADMIGTSKSTAHRNYTSKWAAEMGNRDTRRIER